MTEEELHLIVHKRTANPDDNLLVIEIKWKNSPEEKIELDRLKLGDIRERYSYDFCILLILPRNFNNFENNSVIEFIR